MQLERATGAKRVYSVNPPRRKAMRRTSTLTLWIILGITLASRICYADVIAVVPGSGGFQNALWNGNVTIGWQFTLSSSVTVTELGFFEATGSLSDPHPVGIWNSGGTLLGSATVPAGTPTMLLNGFDFVPVTPFTLGAGMYTIGAYGNGTSPDQFKFGLTGSTTIPGLTIGNGVSSAFGPTTLTFPTMPVDGTKEGYFGPDFLVATSTVPEPSTCTLLSIAFGLLVCFKARL
jgi:hypothetical protein